MTANADGPLRPRRGSVRVPNLVVSTSLFYGNTALGDSFLTVGAGHSFGTDSIVFHDTSVPNLVVKTPLCFESADGLLPTLPFSAVVHGFLFSDR